MKVVVTGAAGMLGQEMVGEFRRRGHDVIALNRGQLDITDLPAVREAIGSLKPDLVVNCAAYTDVDRAESERELAMAVNGLGPRNLALACEARGAALMHISTDYVFDGGKDGPYEIWDMPNPINVYGKTKLWGENYVRSLMHRYYVVRTSWLFGAGGRNFVSTILEKMRLRQAIRVVTDQVGCPTYTRDLARVCADLAGTGCYGIYHVTNQGVTSWEGLAVYVLRASGSDLKVDPITSDQLKRPARRPRNSQLDPGPLAATVGYLPRPWTEAVQNYLWTEVDRHGEVSGQRSGNAC
jgi:dTDP-4-dehydrorhamnose reductase